jgi:hypothetical protein
MAFRKRFQVSDESVNCYGFWIRTEGINLDQAKRNCPAYFNHETYRIPLGHWENLSIEGGSLFADLVIEGATEEEKTYIRKIENGDIKACSGGFDPKKWETEGMFLKEGYAPCLFDSDLFEISIAPLPGNKNALALRGKEGLVTLSDANKGAFIPALNNAPDMKQIALKLGLSENATEQEILTAVVGLQAIKANAEAMQQHIASKAAVELDSDEKKNLFNDLLKTNLSQALSFLSLNATKNEGVLNEGGEAPAAGAAPAAATVPAAGAAGNKATLVTSLIRKPGTSTGSEEAKDGKDSFDYMQKHNRAELSRIRKDEPERYAQLAQGYKDGVRFKG